MRILVCAAAAPLPPTTGFTLVLEALLRELRQRHDVRVVAYRLPGQSGEPPGDVQLIPVRPGGPGDLVAAVVRGRPRFAARLAPGMRAAVRAARDEFRPDAVMVFSAKLADLGPDLQQLPSLIAPLDAVHVGIQTRRHAAGGIKRWLLGIEGWRARRFEATAYRRFDHVVVVSERDRAAIAALDGSVSIQVIPNGVDIDHYRPDPSIPRDPRRIVFTGVMNSPGNIMAAAFAARSVLPLVRREVPDARLTLVGRDPDPGVRALADLDGVEVTGEVPDVRPWLAGSRVFLCPMISGTGIKNKLLEAMAMGLPCVATPLGLGGLDVRDEEAVLMADTEASLAAQLVRVLRDDALAQRLGEEARTYVHDHHAWADVARRYERLLADVGPTTVPVAT